MSVHAAWVIFCASALAIGPAVSAGQESPTKPLKYRRIYVPQDEIDGQARGLLPLRRDEFEERLSKARVASGLGTVVAQARIEGARYRARLEQDSLVEGTAELDIHASGEPLAFAIQPCNLALASAQWHTNPEPVILGQNQKGDLVCIVNESDQLQFDWSLRGKPLPGTGELSFAFQVPLSPMNKLELELPADKVLQCDTGLVQLETSPDPSSTTRQWSVQLAGANEIQLRVLSSEKQPSDEPMSVREDYTYAIRDGAIDIDARLAIEQGIHRRSVMIEADPTGQIISIRSEGRSLDWSIRAVEGMRRTIEIAIPAEAQSPLTIEVNAIAEWERNRTVRLPRLKIVGAKQQGQATVRAAQYLALQARPKGNCQQISFSPAVSAELEQFQFQLHSVDAGIEVHAPKESPALSELCGTHLELQGSRLIATTVAELKAVSGRIFEIDALVPRRFVIDSVDVQPPEMLESQTIEGRRQGPQRIAIMLRRPLEGGRLLRLTIKASADAPAEQAPLPADLLRVATYPLATQSRRSLSLGNSDSSREFRVTSSGPVRRLDAEQLEPEIAALFQRTPGLIFELDGQTGGAEVAIARASPQFAADIAIRADVFEKEIRQTTKVSIRPQSSALSSVSIRFEPSLATTVQFRSGSPTGDLLPTVRRDAPESGRPGDTYLITLPEPTSQSFEIHADFMQPRQREQVLSLAAVEGAASQAGSITIHSTDSALPLVSTTDVTWLPPLRTEDSPGLYTQALHYDPAGLAHVVIKRKSFPVDQHLLWIESLQLNSRLSTDGSGAHEALYRMRNAGQGTFSFRLPYQARGMRVIVDGQDRALVTHTGFGSYQVQLPEKQPLVTVRIQYSSGGIGAYSWSPRLKVAVPLPETSTRVLTSQWQVQLPGGLALVDASKATSAIRESGELLSEQPFLKLPLPESFSASLTLYRSFVIETWCVCAGALGLLLAYRIIGAAPGAAAFVAGALAVVALVAPRDVGLLCLSAGGGLMAGVVARSLAARTASAATSRVALPQQSTAAISAAQSCIIFVLVGLAAAGIALSQDQRPANGEYARVVIPIDREKQPVGDYLYVEPSLYDALVESSKGDPHQDHYLLTSAIYSIPEPPRLANDAASLDELNIRIEFETLRPEATIQLPFRRSELHLIERRALLDGRPLVLDWSPDGDRLSLTARRSGKHRLELVVGAGGEKTETGASLKFSIPRINASRVQILSDCPEGTAIRSAAGAARRLADGGMEFDVGPADQVDLHWPLGPGGEGRASEPAVTQLMLWRMQPNSVVADARFHVRSTAGQLSNLTITTDRRLRLLPQAAAVAATYRVISDENMGSTKIEFEPGAMEATVELSWAWEGGTGFGAMNLPKLHAAGRQVQTWTAILLNPELELESPLQTSDPASQEFLSRWGEAPAGKLLALDRDQPIPAISLRPNSGNVRADEQLTYSVSQRLVKVEFEATLDGLPRLTFQHRLQFDPRLKPLDVRVLENGEAVGARWAVDDKQHLVIQHMRPAAAAQRIRVAAEFAPDRNQSRFDLPLIRYLGGTHRSLTVRVYRQQDVDLRLDPPDAWQQLASAGIGQHQRGLGRLVGEWTYGDEDSPPPLETGISANHPRVTGQMLTRLKRDGDDWWAQVKCSLQVSGGILDGVQLHVPADWKGPFTVQPPAETKLIPFPGARYQILELVPLSPLAGRTQLELSGPWNSNPGENLSAPEVTLLDLPQVNDFVALPRHSSGSRLQWEIGGLQAANSQEVELINEVAAADHEIFKVTGSGFTAVSRVQERAAIRPEVHLAHYNVRQLDENRLVALAQLDVTAPENRRVVLNVPLGWQLLHIRVEGMPCPIARLSSRRWAVTLPAGEWPLRLEAFYSTAVRPVHGEGISVEGLTLADLPNARTVWSVEGPANEAVQPVGASARAASGGLERLESLAAVLKQVTSMHSTPFETPVLASTYQVWESRFEQARLQVSRLELSRDEQRRMLRSIATANQARQEARSLGLSASDSSNVLSPLDEAPAAHDGERVWDFVGKQDDLARPRIALSYRTAAPRPSWPRWPIALLAASIALAAVTKSSRLQSWVVEHCRLLLAVLGVIWLAVGPISWLGWLLISAAILSSVFSPWRRFSGDSRLRRSTVAAG